MLNEIKTKEILDMEYESLFRGEPVSKHNISIDEFSLTEEQKAKIEEEYIKVKNIIKFNIKEFSKGKNLANPKKVQSLKALRILDKTTYKDLDSFIKALISHKKIGTDKEGKGTINWSEAVNFSKNL